MKEYTINFLSWLKNLVYLKSDVDSKLQEKSDTSHSHSAVTTSSNGFMSSSDKSKLDGITSSADSVSFTRSKTSGTKIGTITINGTGTDIYCNDDTNTTYSTATTSSNGLMSSSDKSKLDGISTGANKITVDSALSSSSTNPVQNKVVNSALSGKASSSHTHNDYTAGSTITSLSNASGTIRCYKKNGFAFIIYEFTVSSSTTGSWLSITTLPYSNQTGQKVWAEFSTGAGLPRVRVNESAQLQCYVEGTNKNRYGFIIYPTTS